MPSFVAPCPRGHMGNFVTHDGYHHCFCNLHIPVFVEDIEGPYVTPKQTFLNMSPKEQEKLMEQYIQEGIAERVQEAITDTEGEIEEEYQQKIDELEDRLMVVDPEFDR